MLAPEHRLRRSTDFRDVLRAGRRGSRPLLTVHLLLPAEPSSTGPASTDVTPAGPPAVRAGLVVSKAVGGSVVRSRVSRRLRHQLRSRIAGLPAGSRLVVRAAPAAALATSDELGSALDAALASAARRPVRSAGLRDGRS